MPHPPAQLFEKPVRAPKERKVLGNWGETLAARYLEGQGCRILERQYRAPGGEVDLIAQTGGFLLFVEVKLRTNNRYGTAVEAVTPGKQARIRTVAEQYLEQTEASLQPRFDVIEVYAPFGCNTEHPKLDHWENAF